MTVVDVRDAADPKVVTNYHLDYFAQNIAVSNQIAYVANYQRLNVYNFTNPYVPTSLSSYLVALDIEDVVVSGSLTYLIDGANLVVLNMSNLRTPRLLRNYLVSSGANLIEMKLFNSTGYIIDTTGSLRIVDLGNSTNPRLLSSYPVVQPRSLDVVGSVIKSTAAYSGIISIKIANNYCYFVDDDFGILHIAYPDNIVTSSIMLQESKDVTDISSVNDILLYTMQSYGLVLTSSNELNIGWDFHLWDFPPLTLNPKKIYANNKIY